MTGVKYCLERIRYIFRKLSWYAVKVTSFFVRNDATFNASCMGIAEFVVGTCGTIGD